MATSMSGRHYWPKNFFFLSHDAFFLYLFFFSNDLQRECLNLRTQTEKKRGGGEESLAFKQKFANFGRYLLMRDVNFFSLPFVGHKEGLTATSNRITPPRGTQNSSSSSSSSSGALLFPHLINREGERTVNSFSQGVHSSLLPMPDSQGLRS